MTRTLPVALATGLAVAASAAAQTWQDLGPSPLSGFGGTAGRIAAIAASRTNANRFYVGGADGGVWRTTDGGSTWTPLTDQQATTATGALAIDPTNESIIYAGTGEANFANHSRYGVGLLKSIDGGDTWMLLAQNTFAGRCFSRIVINPQNTQVLYAAITRAGGFPELSAAKGHPGAGGARGVFRSTDGGQTWSQLAGGLPALDATDLAMDPTNAQVLYAAIGRIFGDAANGVYKSTDGGNSWARLAGGLPTSGNGRISIAVAPSNPQRLYALISNPSDSAGNGASLRNGYRSDNGGTSWVTINPSVDQSSYGWYLSVVAVHPTSPDTVVMAGLSIARSTNAGSSWSTISAPHPDNHALAFDASNNLLCGDDGGVHKSTNLGSSWASLNTGLATVQIYPGLSLHPANLNTLLGGMQDNGVNLRTAATRSWSSVLGGDGGWTQIDPTNGQRMFGENQGTGSLYRSTNGGSSFNFAGNGLDGRNCFEPPFLIDPANSQRMLYGTERVNVSTDGGLNWSPLSPDLTGGGSAAIRALAISPVDSSYVYAATNDGRVLSSSNSGSTFTLRLTGNAGWPRVTRELTADPVEPQTVYLAGATFGVPHVRRSRDNGATWETLDGNLPDIPVNVISVDGRGPAPAIFVGTDAGLYRSVNDGATWRKYLSGLPNAQVNDARVDTAHNRIVVGTMGRGAWSAPLVQCYADFDDDSLVTVNDFIAFINAFAAGSPRANCDQSTEPPTLNVNDFICFSVQAAGATVCP